MKTKIYAVEPIRTETKTFKRGEIIAEIDAPLTTAQLVSLLTSGQASDAKPLDPEPTDVAPKPKVDADAAKADTKPVTK